MNKDEQREIYSELSIEQLLIEILIKLNGMVDDNGSVIVSEPIDVQIVGQ